MDFSRYDLIPYGPFLEEWKPIEGFGGMYEVSNYGRVKSLINRFINSKNRTWNGYNRDGYRFISCVYNGEKKVFRIHILVAKYFISNPENKPFVNHIRGFRDDNCFTQLEWVTQAENNIHAYKYLCVPMPFKVEKGKQWKSKRLKRTCLLTGDVKFYEYCQLVENDGFDPKQVSGAASINKRTHNYKNYKWQYEDN